MVPLFLEETEVSKLNIYFRSGSFAYLVRDKLETVGRGEGSLSETVDCTTEILLLYSLFWTP